MVADAQGLVLGLDELQQLAHERPEVGRRPVDLAAAGVAPELVDDVLEPRTSR